MQMEIVPVQPHHHAQCTTAAAPAAVAAVAVRGPSAEEEQRLQRGKDPLHDAPQQQLEPGGREGRALLGHEELQQRPARACVGRGGGGRDSKHIHASIQK